jgi:hypothetical protein
LGRLPTGSSLSALSSHQHKYLDHFVPLCTTSWPVSHLLSIGNLKVGLPLREGLDKVRELVDNHKGDHKMLGLRSRFLRHSFAYIFLAIRAGCGVCCGKISKDSVVQLFAQRICSAHADHLPVGTLVTSPIKTFKNLRPRLNYSPGALRRFPP